MASRNRGRGLVDAITRDLGRSTKSIHRKIYGVRRQAKRDVALESAGGTESTKAPKW
jgi:hypothetical protein